VTAPAQITLLTQTSCNMCTHAKTVLHRLEQEYRLSVQELDLASADGQQLAARAGVMFAPGLLLDGQMFSFGRVSERKLRRALDHRQPEPPAG
jgi:glutaredoxin